MRRYLLGLAVVSAVLWAAPARADIVDPAGACVASATWSTAGLAAASPDLTPDRVLEIPRADRVAWSGRVVGPAAGASREVSGRVALALPPPFGSLTLADWGGPATDVERAGSYDYDLPSIVPAGVVLNLLASHDEAGQRHCTASVGVTLAGGPSPLAWVALLAALLFGGAVLLLGRGASSSGRIVGGALLGLPFGLFVGLTLVLLGVIPLASGLVTLLPVLGAAVGALWTWWRTQSTRSVVPSS
jgi:hypothetical protein